MINVCENCKERTMCDQVTYDCPLCDFKGVVYKFQDSKGEEYRAAFKSRDNASDFAYRAGLCFLGRE